MKFLDSGILTQIILLAAALSCTTTEIHMRRNIAKISPSRILIGRFECRNLGFDPYVADNFRDALRFEFFRHGYTVHILSLGGAIASSGKTPGENDDEQKSAEKTPSDSKTVLVRGVIAETDRGDILKPRTSTMIIISILSRDGSLLGETRCITNRSLSNAAFLRNIAGRLAGEISVKLGGP